MIELGLGCSRFGSLTGGTDRRTAAALLEAAAELGVCHFDTANIYGQGDSERFLGQLLPLLPNAVVTTKAGQRFPLAKRLILTAKPLLRPIVARHKQAAAATASNRAGLLPQDWSPRHLAQSLDSSLRRLRREQVDNFMLHSPDETVLRRGEAMAVLSDLKQQGKAVRIGASVDDVAAFEAAIEDDRVEIVQVPLAVLRRQPQLGERASRRNVILVVRELFAGSGTRDIERAMAAVPPCANVALIGTGKPAHLREAHHALLKVPSC